MLFFLVRLIMPVVTGCVTGCTRATFTLKAIR
jgi:hypothetical protein